MVFLFSSTFRFPSLSLHDIFRYLFFMIFTISFALFLFIFFSFFLIFSSILSLFSFSLFPPPSFLRLFHYFLRHFSPSFFFFRFPFHVFTISISNILFTFYIMFMSSHLSPFSFQIFLHGHLPLH